MAAGFGAFGKIASLGDFLRLNLPLEFIRVWDAWLQNSLSTARQRLGPQWDERYLSAPIWRFSLPGGICGPHGYSGVLMASVDRVGRQYPLTLAAPTAPGQTALRHFCNEDAFAALEDIALSTLDDDGSREQLQSALSGMALVIPSPRSLSGSSYAGPVSAEQALAAEAFDQTFGTRAIWTTEIAGDHRMLATSGLPDASQVLALFDLDATAWQDRRAEQAL